MHFLYNRPASSSVLKTDDRLMTKLPRPVDRNAGGETVGTAEGVSY